MKKRTGFALLSPEQRSEMARVGAMAAGTLGRRHKWNTEAAAQAGRKGGLARARKLRKECTAYQEHGYTCVLPAGHEGNHRGKETT